MKSRIYYLLLFFIQIALSFSVAGQNPYSDIDSFVVRLGALSNANVATITEKLTLPYSEKEKKARAIFSWIANNIAMDAKAMRALDQKNTEPEKVISSRKTTPLGYSLLFQEMCSQASIRCLSVDGFVKINTADFEETYEAPNFSWNVVQLGNSPSEWFYVDCAQAAGRLDSKKNIFTAKYYPQYFFSDKTCFNLEHFPDNMAWYLGEGMLNVKSFHSLPIIQPAAYIYLINRPDPLNNTINTKPGIPCNFRFKSRNLPENPTVTVIIGDGAKKQPPQRVNIQTSGNEISFQFIFKKEDSYPLTICINEMPVLTYFANISE